MPRGRQLLFALPFAVALAYQAGRWWTVTQFYRIDFSVYYWAVKSGGGSLYDYRFPRDDFRFNYPPFAALLLKPLTLLSYDIAEYVWFVTALAATGAFAWFAARRAAPRSGALEALAPAFLMLMVPVMLTLRLGQINSLVAILIFADVVLFSRGSRYAGLGTGLAAALKITPAFIAVAFFCGGRRRAAYVATAVFAATVALSLAFYPSATWRYFTGILWDTRRVGRVETSFNQRQPDGFAADFSNALRRPISWLPGSSAAHTAIWIALGAAVAALALVRARRAFAAHDYLAGVAIAACAGYLLSPITWAHHLYFAGPAAVMFAAAGGARNRMVGLAGAFVLLDPVEGGEGSYLSLARIGFLLAVVTIMPHTTRARTRYTETPSARR